MQMRTILSALLVTVLATGLFGCSVMSGNRSADTYATDAATTAKVKANIARNDMVPASQVTVNTDKGVVQLSGFVRTKAQADEAEKTALNTEGVKSVKNDLVTYKEAHGKSIKDKVKRKLTYTNK
jgi:hyperosmotically inducible protein